MYVRRPPQRCRPRGWGSSGWWAWTGPSPARWRSTSLSSGRQSYGSCLFLRSCNGPRPSPPAPSPEEDREEEGWRGSGCFNSYIRCVIISSGVPGTFLKALSWPSGFMEGSRWMRVSLTRRTMRWSPRLYSSHMCCIRLRRSSRPSTSFPCIPATYRNSGSPAGGGNTNTQVQIHCLMLLLLVLLMFRVQKCPNKVYMKL